MADNEHNVNAEISRRRFLKMVGGMAAGVALGGAVPQMIRLKDGMVAIPASEGYLLVDTKKCAACNTCMFACSMAHHGKINLTLSRIQVLRDPLAKFPDDIEQYQCRQCAFPACVEACPTGALAVNPDNGNVRMVDERKCIGCMQCMEACPHEPSRVQWNHEERHSQKCDLCANTPYWNDDRPACASLCPMKAIKFTKEIPVQFGQEGYQVNLRTDKWDPKHWLFT